jgi:membrane-bound metal-dependent hydrolase YbcI (DUF457 family)
VDIATHLLVPYAGLLAAYGYWRRGREADERRASYAVVFGLAGFSPDLDGALDPLSSRFDALYWLQHRGVSHTLVGAPLFALLLTLALALIARRWPRRFGLFAWRPGLALVAVVGSWTHLVLDGVTLAGVPLLWPLAFGRFGYPLFHWLVFWLFPLGALALGAHALGRLSRRGVVMAGALIVVALIVVAGVRVATRPDLEDAYVYPRASDLEWIVVQPLANGSWAAATHRLGVESSPLVFQTLVPDEAREAVAAARATAAYRGFLMGSYGPVATHAEPTPQGGWNVTITDVAQRYEALHDPRWTPTDPFEDWGYVRFHVDGERVEVLHRGW